MPRPMLPPLNTKMAIKVLVNFIRDEVAKSPFDKCIMGLSGGVDSAVVAYLASKAVGNKNLIALLMPYKKSTRDVIDDARLVANRLKIKAIQLDITPVIDTFIKNHPHDDPRRLGSRMVRERTALLYYYADIYKAAVLGTSNKSETLLGYFTKWGDPASDIMPLRYLYKTHVWQLARALRIPSGIIEKPPSGGMWPGQKDEEEFGFSYEEADPLLYYMVDMGYSENDLQKMGFAQNLIIKVKERVRKAEFKRKPPIMPALPPYVFNTPFSVKKRRRLLRVGIVYNKAHINTTEQKVYKKRPWLIGKTLKTIKDTIRERGYEVIPFDANEHLFENLKYTPVDIVFNIAAGGRGESRQTFLPSLFDFYSIPFTGTGVYGNVLGLDKSITKHLLMSNGIPTPPFQVFRKHTEKLSNHLSFPLIVKPIAEGSSHGIDRESVVNTKQKLQVIVKRILDNFHQPAIVEQYIDGRELTIGIVGNEKPEFLAILETAAPPAKLKGKKLLTDDLKVKEGYFSDRTRVAKLSREKVKEVRELALKAYRVIRCNDYARIDIILDKRDKLWIIEVNTMPGLFMDYSGYVVCALKAGISYPQLINKILDSAFERYPALQKFK